MAEMTGASLTEFTVSVKLVFVPALLVSTRERVMVAVPNWFAAGVTVTVRLLPLPPKTMLAGGTRVGLEELELKVSSVAGVVSSPTVNGMAAVEVSSLTVWAAIPLMVGGTLAEALT